MLCSAHIKQIGEMEMKRIRLRRRDQTDRFIGRKRSAHSVSEGGWVDGTLRFGQRNSD